MKELKPSVLIAIEVPEHAMGAVTYQSEYSDKYVLRWIDDIINIVDLPKGKWEFIGSVTAEHIDFDPEPYVDKTKHYTWGGYGYAKTEDVFVNYMHIDVSICRSPDASFRSLLTANDVHFTDNEKYLILKPL